MKYLITSLFAICIFALSASAKVEKTTIQLQKGQMQVFDYGTIKLHAYQTNDMMTNYVLILEKVGKAVMIESPAFWDNFNELRTYLIDNNLKIDAIIPSYHPLGASFIDTKELANMDVYFTQHVLDYWETGFGAVMKQGIPKVFGDKVDSSFYKPTIVLEEGETEISGIKMILKKSYDGFDVEIPEINTVYVHILGHDSHSEILGHEHLESSIVNFKQYLAKGYLSFLSSHYEPETKIDMETKVAYLEEMKVIVEKSHNADEFIKSMQDAFPGYNERYLNRTSEMFFSNAPKKHKHK